MLLRNSPASQMLVARLIKLNDKQLINRFFMTNSIDKNETKSYTDDCSHPKDTMTQMKTQMKMNNENLQKEDEKGMIDYSEEPIGQAIYLRSRQEVLNDITKQFEKGEMYSLSIDPISGYPLNED